MYRKFFGLTDYPFNDNPDPRFFCSTPEVDEAFTSLMLGVRERRGLILLTGEVGTGKTTLLKTLMDRLDKNLYRTAFVFNPRLNTLQLLDFMLSDFGIEHEMADKGTMLAKLKRWLLERKERGGTAVLVIDEAQNLSPPVLEEVRLLNNLETPVEKLLQIVISGQPELEAMILRPEFRALRLRFAHWAKTRALTLEETNVYIAYRLRVAGGNIKDIFTPESVAHIHRFSRGIPRLINLLCAHSLVSAYADEEKPVPYHTVEELASQFELDLNAFLYRPLPAPLGTEEDVEVPGAAAPPTSSEAAADSAAGPIEGSANVASPTEPRAAASITPESAPPSSAPATNGAVDGTPAAGPAATPSAPLVAAEQELSGPPSAGTDTPEGGEVSPSILADGPGFLRPEPAPPRGARSLNIIHPPPQSSHRVLPFLIAALVLAATGLTLTWRYYAQQGKSLSALWETTPEAHASSDSATSTSTEGAATSPADLAPASTSTPQILPPDSATETPAPIASSASPPATSVAPPSSALPSVPPKTVPASLLKPSSPPAIRATGIKPPPPRLSAAAAPAALPPPKPMPTKMGVLEVTANLDGAQISLDGHTDPSWVTPHTFAHLPPGLYNLLVSKIGYRSSEQVVEVTADRTARLTASLSPPSGLLSFVTTPPGADVVIDGKVFGATPVRAALPPGPHAYAISHAGFESTSGTLSLRDEESVTKTLELRPLPPPTPKPTGPNLQMATTPPGATVYLDGAPVSGLTPASLRVAPGSHTIIFVLAGYRAARKEVNVPADDAIAVSQTLLPQ